MLEIILGVIVVIFIFAFVYIIYNNKFKLAIIKIDKAEEDINLYLQKKNELLQRSQPIVKKELKLEDFLVELDVPFVENNNFENHLLLKKCYNELFKTIDDNDKLLKSDSLISIIEELNTNEENIIGAIKFYNDTVVEFNQLVVTFPSLIIAFLKRYKKKDFYNNEKREIFEILNSK